QQAEADRGAQQQVGEHSARPGRVPDGGHETPVCAPLEPEPLWPSVPGLRSKPLSSCSELVAGVEALVECDELAWPGWLARAGGGRGRRPAAAAAIAVRLAPAARRRASAIRDWGGVGVACMSPGNQRSLNAA